MRMSITIRDQDAYLALEAARVADYLRAHGWECVRNDLAEGRGSAWILRENSGRQLGDILLPHTRALGDYAVRMSDVVQELERVEQRTQLEIYCDLNPAALELLPANLGPYRLVHPRAALNGTVPSHEAPSESHA